MKRNLPRLTHELTRSQKFAAKEALGQCPAPALRERARARQGGGASGHVRTALAQQAHPQTLGATPHQTPQKPPTSTRAWTGRARRKHSRASLDDRRRKVVLPVHDYLLRRVFGGCLLTHSRMGTNRNEIQRCMGADFNHSSGPGLALRNKEIKAVTRRKVLTRARFTDSWIPQNGRAVLGQTVTPSPSALTKEALWPYPQTLAPRFLSSSVSP